MKTECNMTEVDYMQMKNRCMWTITRIALSSLPTNARHHSTYAIELHFCSPPMEKWETVFFSANTLYYYTMMVGDMQRWRLIVRDIVVSMTLHLDIVIIFHVAARRVLQLMTIRWLTSEYRSYFSWRAFIFTVHMTFNVSPLTAINHALTFYCTILLWPITRDLQEISIQPVVV